MPVLTNGKLFLGKYDLSGDTNRMEIHPSRETPDDTVMGTLARIGTPGLEVVTIDLVCKQEFSTAAPAMDATLWGIHNGGVAVPITIRPVVAARSSSNPEWGLNVVLANYDALSGAVGDNLQTPVKLMPASAISRTVSSS